MKQARCICHAVPNPECPYLADAPRPPEKPEGGALGEIRAELERARRSFGPMRGPHEGWAVIREEVDELWDEVKRKDRNVARMRKEAVQVAAMAARFIEDVCDGL